ncbi:hypothetical protein Pcinc_021906 [Petrolisthes cinctipes]|uniref:Uncharacterized protein n=1 Tax=Petrolisthes cinctipes TaxID=88211 RepID=A0AAE1KJ56_PETCI|nr:hypothetical protein Pcinc_021906 [Petrolisthes cinctipes]
MHTWPRRVPPPTTSTTSTSTITMGPQKTLLLLILIRVATGAPVEGETPHPTPSPSDLAALRKLSTWSQQQQQQQHHTPPPPPPTVSPRAVKRLKAMVLPDNFTIHKHCLAAIVRELCFGIFNNPRPAELEARRGNNNFTCMGQGCSLQQLNRYCNQTPDFLNQDPTQSQPMATNAPHSHSTQQPLHGTLQSPNRRGLPPIQGLGWSSQRCLSRRRSTAPFQNREMISLTSAGIRTTLTRQGYKRLEGRVVASFPASWVTVVLYFTRVAAFRLLLSEYMSHTNRRSVARLLLERAYESLIKQRKHPFPKQPTKGRGRRLRRKRRLYNRAQGVRRKPSPINHSLEYSGPSDLLHHHP